MTRRNLLAAIIASARAAAADALQAWLEVAWQAGFDPGGAAMFGSAVQGTRKWIGTTEAAAMLRYFGCRALIVDFYGELESRGCFDCNDRPESLLLQCSLLLGGEKYNPRAPVWCGFTYS